MAKKVTAEVKLQIPAGKATPAPPVGTALGPQGVNIMEFCKAFNAKTSAKDQEGLIIPVVITIYSDRSFTFITKTPPAPELIKKAAGADWYGEWESQKKRKVDESKVVVDGEKDVGTATTEMDVDKGGMQEVTNTHTLFANMGGFNLKIYALSLPEQDHSQRNRTSPDNVSQAGITVGAVNRTAAVEKSAIIQEVSFPLENWPEVGKYTPKLQSS